MSERLAKPGGGGDGKKSIDGSEGSSSSSSESSSSSSVSASFAVALAKPGFEVDLGGGSSVVGISRKGRYGWCWR
jgi:hypothetical protein